MATQQQEVHLTEWNKIKAEIVSAKDIHIMGKMNYSLEAIQKWAKQSKQSLETQNEIADYRLRINRKQGEWIEQNIPEEGGGDHRPNLVGAILTLAEAGIDKHDSPKFRMLAKIPEEKFESYIKDKKANVIEITTDDACRLLRDTIALKWTGDQESFTPSIYIEAARGVMGSIDLDPASSDYAQQTVKAKAYFTKDNDGLAQPWVGNIFLNPPYNQPDISLFVNKLLSVLKDGQQAILLTNNNTDTSWFHKAAARATGICFTKGRINFYKNDGSLSSPTNGQVFFYFGHNGKDFKQYFSTFGLLFESLGAGFDGVFDWDFLLPAFNGTKIEPMDIDAVVERRGKILIFETKPPGKVIPLGQEITLKTLLGIGQGAIHVMIIYGKTAETIVSMEEWRWGNKIVEVRKELCGSSHVLSRVTEWFRWANGNGHLYGRF